MHPCCCANKNAAASSGTGRLQLVSPSLKALSCAAKARYASHLNINTGGSMKLSLRGGKEILQEHAKRRAHVLITLLDGSLTEIKPETDGEFEIGLDYILIDVDLKGEGPLPYAPSFIPFSSIKSI